jgi:hypothetical protein
VLWPPSKPPSTACNSQPLRHRLGPPGTNANVIGKAFDEGGARHRQDDQPRRLQGRQRRAALRALKTEKSQEIYGWQNIELISDRPFKVWIDEFKQLKDKYPDKIVIASIMEEYNKDAWSRSSSAARRPASTRSS